MITLAASCANETTDRKANVSAPHILLVVDQLPATLGGGERIALKIARLLPEYGFRVSILTFLADAGNPALQDPPCPIYLLPLRRTYDLSAFGAALELRRFLSDHRVAIVQTFFESSDIWAGFVTKIASPAKLIWSRRDMGILRGKKHKIAYRVMAALPDAVFAVSEQVRRYCIDVDRIRPERLRTIYNGIELPETRPQTAPADSTRGVSVASLGNVRAIKGHDVLIRAAASVLADLPDVYFTVGGEVLERQYFSSLQERIIELGISERFKFCGGIADPYEYLSTADIFVLPSRSEGFSNSIIEAMAASLPVIATDVGGNAEAVVDGVTGFIIPPDDPEALALRITELATNRSLAAAMGEAGRERARELFTTEAMMNRITHAYRQLLV